MCYRVANHHSQKVLVPMYMTNRYHDEVQISVYLMTAKPVFKASFVRSAFQKQTCKNLKRRDFSTESTDFRSLKLNIKWGFHEAGP
jgi:hypothetical protein